MATLPRCGRLPNVYWQALSMDELRREPRFEALPPAERVVLVGRLCQRCVLTMLPLLLAPPAACTSHYVFPSCTHQPRAAMCARKTSCGHDYTPAC